MVINVQHTCTRMTVGGYKQLNSWPLVPGGIHIIGKNGEHLGTFLIPVVASSFEGGTASSRCQIPLGNIDVATIQDDGPKETVNSRVGESSEYLNISRYWVFLVTMLPEGSSSTTHPDQYLLNYLVR